MKTITPQELKKRLEQQTVCLIDVREPAEYKRASIEGACLIPLDKISLETLPLTNHEIVIHCQAGPRSATACAKLLSADPSLKIAMLEGGVQSWQQSGFTLKTSGSQLWSLDRQTQIVAGSLIFFGTILGSYVHANFYFIPGAIGIGLMFAGVSGWCGMAKFLAKMPWNS